MTIPLIIIAVCLLVGIGAAISYKTPTNPVTELTEQLIEVEADEMVRHNEDAKSD
jgi:hypothetical protein